jgi:hypothetical protein
MATSLKKLSARRARNVVILLGLIACLLVWDRATAMTLRDTAFVSGWLLLGLVLLLTLYNARKKLPFLPLGNSAGWLQLHAYAGLLSGVVFGMHVAWRVPNGWFEMLFALVFLLVFLSGIVGLVASRVFARRMGGRGGDVLYSRIPRLRHQLRVQTEQLILDCTAKTESSALLEFYANRLEPFFDRPCHFFRHLLLSDRPLRQLRQEIRSQSQFLDETERDSLRNILDNVQQKNELDFHFAHQATLKYWLFIHIPLTYAMLVFAVIHVVLVHAFWT